MVKIFVGNLPGSCPAADLRALFEAYGLVNECDVLGGYAFVHMEKEAEAKRAILELRGRPVRGSPLTVELATARLRNATKLYVGNVAEAASTRELQALFERHGRVVECDIVKNYAFVHMEKERQALDAIRALSGTELAGQRIYVQLSKSNPVRGPPAAPGLPPAAAAAFLPPGEAGTPFLLPPGFPSGGGGGRRLPFPPPPPHHHPFAPRYYRYDPYGRRLLPPPLPPLPPLPPPYARDPRRGLPPPPPPPPSSPHAPSASPSLPAGCPPPVRPGRCPPQQRLQQQNLGLLSVVFVGVAVVVG
ncbi:RNA-binding protein 4.1-like [Hemiscyllium ocellatum]|uniref:RNA-binding protein 4.1-like n=1 Tax=Hemiscyllium ocellatum TaxID=170820 RepID=UPI002965FB28|nr:RNA-binding protein 4.1-like [Hemiscyllium ocellatum]